MITLLTGDNNFELTRALDRIIADFDGTAEKFNGSELELSQLPDLLLGGTLFSTQRLIIIRELSANKVLWDVLPDWLSKIDVDTTLILVEPKPDKRTRTYKELKKQADIREFQPWTERDGAAAEAWAIQEAGRQQLTLDKKSARLLVERVGTDQWQLFHALEKLAALGTGAPEVIERVIEANPTENVFNLLDAALSGKVATIQSMIHVLRRSQDPYMTMGLLSGQVFQLAALAYTDKPTAQVAADIGAHPYALGKLAPRAKSLGKAGTRQILTIFADTDTAMKSSGTDPWLLIEHALIKTSQL